VVQFLVGLIVGASAVLLLAIVIGPSRRVRAERPLPPDVEAKILLGQDPDDRTVPPAPAESEHEPMYSQSDLAELRRIGEERQRRRKR
jgi:hypothetical protein